MIPTHHKVPGQEKVTLKTKVMWGFGGLADNFMFNTLSMLGTLVYVTHFKMTPAMAGVALAMPRLIDAFTDPWIGNMSDNARTRMGRRRPFMLVGAVLSAFILPFLWTPIGIETIHLPWYQNLPFIYICIMGSMLAVTYTLYVVPYTALGFEMTPNYDERSRVVVWRMYIGLFGSLAAGWLFRMVAADRFDDIGQGAFYVSIGVAAIVIVAGLIPVFGCKEDLTIEEQPTINLWEAIRLTLCNKPFVILLIAYIAIVMALFVSQTSGPLLLLHYVFSGNEKALGNYTGLLGTMAMALSYVSMFLILKISIKSNKRNAMLVGLGLVLLGTFAYYFAINPKWPWALYLAGVIMFLGMQGCWLMIDSMTADVCDEDELKSGRRREGMYSAVKGFALKAGQAITFAIGGYLATAAGFDPEIVAASGLDEPTAFRLKNYMIGLQSLGLIIAMILVWFYPITREQAEKTRKLLDESAS